jgi:murein DD-endopeptidase MepM/ murein hydrolase activator NlpD
MIRVYWPLLKVFEEGFVAKRQGRQLSILIIPDDGSSTREFKLGYGVLRSILVGEVLLVVLVILGGVFYWRSLYWESEALRLIRDNQGLQNEMRQVGELADAVTRMKQVDRQFRAMLSPAVKLPDSPLAALQTQPPALNTGAGARMARTVVRVPSSGLSTTDTRLVPSSWPVGRFDGVVTREFVPPTGTVQKGHSGIDIAATEGAIVTATADGRVVFAGEDDLLGLVLSIDHFGAYLTRYGHNSALLIRSGEAVRKGQPIALVGNTGKSSGPHLHYEIWQQGTARNPRDFLPGS